MRPVALVSTIAAISIGQLVPISASRGRESGSLSAAACTIAMANQTPAMPPKEPSSKLSVNNCRNIVLRPAPRARRTPNSRLRPLQLVQE
jgi:hypothetical protein